MPTASQHAPDPGRSRTLTLLVASASSVVAAIVVSKVWGPGTLVGAAATPIIVTLVGELLHKPAEKINVVRVTPSGTRVLEQVEPADAPVGAVIAPPDDMAPTSVHRARRSPVRLALVTGLIAFVIGALALSATELVFGDKLGSGGGSTTYFRGGARSTGTSGSQGTGTSDGTGSTPSTPAATTTTTTTTPVPAPATSPQTTSTSPTTDTAPPSTETAPPTGVTVP